MTGSRLQGWLVPGALLLVAGVLAFFTLRPADEPPIASWHPSPTEAVDDHSIQVGDAALSFTLVDGAIVIARTSGGTTTELVRQPVSTERGPGGSDVVSGALGMAMACGVPGTASYGRYIFGHVDLLKSALSSAAPSFAAPAGVGRIAADGLFLFVIDATVPDANAAVRVMFEGQPLIGMGGGVFTATATYGTKEPSGCLVAG
jgi:hypothetical protein